jgi:sugar/nucleoside kinase (ribokinase family)
VSAGAFFVTGDLNLDTTTIASELPAVGKEAQARIMTSFGGQGGNVAYFLCCLGRSVELFGCLGTDAAGMMYRDYLGRLGIHFAGIEDSAPTGMVSVVQEGTGYHMYRQRGANGTITAATLAAFLQSALAASPAALFISGYSLLGEDCPATLAALSGVSSFPTALDPASIDAMKGIGKANVLGAARRCRYFLPNEEEACWLAEADDPEAAARTLRDLTGTTVIVKLGPRGALLLSGDGVKRAPVLSSTPPVDVTGAGDAFAAAFLAACADGADDGTALGRAVAFSSAKVHLAGTQPPPFVPGDTPSFSNTSSNRR